MNKYIITPNGQIQISDDIMEWGEWYEQCGMKPIEQGGRKVGHDELPGDVLVSTVFLSIDHNFCGGDPILFETMIFAKGSEHDEYQERYKTLEEAREGHKRALALMKQEEENLPMVVVDDT